MAEFISMLDPHVLKAHPRNAEFFDDINGDEFDRLVESIKEHGVLTPLRATKDMTLISGHQRMRAAIEAGITEVPVIIDGSDDKNDILMKLIETNFGRMKNDPIKQAKWIKEYENLKGVRQGSAGNADRNNCGRLTQTDVANALGVSETTIRNLKSLLKLDPTLQSLISEGKITPTTGFKLLTMLSPEEQSALIDKLPDNVKFSAKSIETYIEQMREELNGKTAKVMQEKDKLIGEKEQLVREKNELLAGNIPENASIMDRNAKLEEENRKYYEQYQAAQKLVEVYKKENAKLNAAQNADNGAVELQNEIDELKEKLDAEIRKSNDLEYQLEEKEDEITDLKREKKEGFERKALRLNETPDDAVRRERDALISDIQIAIGKFQAAVEGSLTQIDDFDKIDKLVLKTLVETCSQALAAGNRLKTALISASGYQNSNNDNDLDYELDDSGLEFNLGA